MEHDGGVESHSRLGRKLRSLVPLAVEEILDIADPVRVILFGSVARGRTVLTATWISWWYQTKSNQARRDVSGCAISVVQ
jgi:hypothetical protein